jgi:predicted TIM-barrel enzyme
MIRQANGLNMLTCPYVFSEEEAVKMTEAKADIIVAHMNTTNKGAIGVKTTITLEEAAKRVQAICNAAKNVNEDIIVICHGGPIADPDDVQYIYNHTEGVAGFFGASSIERLATEPAIERQTRKFKGLKL